MLDLFKKNNSDINFIDTLNESDRAFEMKAKRSSNQIFVLSGLILVVILVVVFFVSSQNYDITQKLKDTEEYLENQKNIDSYNINDEYKKKTEKIKIYNVASDKFINQLKDSKRFSSKWIDFFDLNMKESLPSGTEASIQQFQFSKNILQLNCTTNNSDYPRVYASKLSQMKKEDGDPMFKEVGYKGFSGDGSKYSFQIALVLW